MTTTLKKDDNLMQKKNDQKRAIKKGSKMTPADKKLKINER
jgi:hypothetical protein